MLMACGPLPLFPTKEQHLSREKFTYCDHIIALLINKQKLSAKHSTLKKHIFSISIYVIVYGPCNACIKENYRNKTRNIYKCLIINQVN